MRCGIEATSLAKLIASKKARNDMTLQWKHPEYPVICQVFPGTRQFNTAEPAGPQLIDSMTKRMANTAGFIGWIHSHAMRLGYA